ncbi:MAG: C25 family cysteine peptidase, partial [Candidatus Thorarchaeota archaeon]
MKNYEKEKVLGLLISVLIVISSITMIEVVFSPNHQQVTAAKTCETTFPKCPFEVKSILTEDGTWKSFNDNYPVGTPARAYVAVSDTAGITVVADIYGFWKGEETIYNGSIFDTVTIPGMTTSGEVGKPVLPRLRKTLEIPHGVDITSEVLFGESSVIDDYRIISALPPVAPVWKLNDSQSETQHTFHAVYSSDSLYPSYNVSLGGNIEADSIIFRGRRLLELTINPVQYNPASKELTVYSKMIVKLNYSTPAQILPVRASLYSEPFEKMFESILLNYKPWNNYSSVISNPDNFVFPRTRTALSQGSIQAEYLIITTSDFLPAVEDLADWKNRKGIRTHIELVTRDSPASDIHDILHDAYYEWALAPTYVLLFGDCENVTNDYGIIHKGSLSYNEIGPIGTYFSLSTGFIGTDQTYFELEGTDYFPDVFSGRLSVDTLDQANIVVSKIIEYETSPPTNTVFYRNILSSASFEDFNLDGIEEADYEYVYAAENVTHYLDGLYTIHRNYTACYDGTDGALPLSFSGASFCTHLQSYPWIPSEQTPTTESKQWLYLEWGAQNFSANINEGRFFIYNVDHGGSQNMKYYDYGGGPDWCDGWGGPGFNTGTVDNPNHLGYLTNDQSGEHPFIVSTGCNTGWFDGEIDQNFMDSGFDETSYESIAEEITRIEGGAIAVVGASRHSFNHPSQDLLNGIIQSFWPGYLELTNQPMYELGAALLLGKYNVFLENGIHGKSGVWEETQTTFQIFHLFGDP